VGRPGARGAARWRANRPNDDQLAADDPLRVERDPVAARDTDGRWRLSVLRVGVRALGGGFPRRHLDFRQPREEPLAEFGVERRAHGLGHHEPASPVPRDVGVRGRVEVDQGATAPEPIAQHAEQAERILPHVGFDIRRRHRQQTARPRQLTGHLRRCKAGERLLRLVTAQQQHASVEQVGPVLRLVEQLGVDGGNLRSCAQQLDVPVDEWIAVGDLAVRRHVEQNVDMIDRAEVLEIRV
jgi:hypothetical protein